MAPAVPGLLADQPSWARVIRHARCADADLDPDQWFPVSAKADKARAEAAAALAVCGSCLVRGQCLALSLRHWDLGQHGIWGGLVAADHAQLRHRIATDHDGYSSAPIHVMADASAR
jgi:hypothetical protein